MGIREAACLCLASEYNEVLEEKERLEEELEEAENAIHDMELAAANTDDDDDDYPKRKCKKPKAPRAPSTPSRDGCDWGNTNLGTAGKIVAGLAIGGAIIYGISKLFSDD